MSKKNYIEIEGVQLIKFVVEKKSVLLINEHTVEKENLLIERRELNVKIL